MSQDSIILGEGRFLRLVKTGTWEYAERVVGTGVVGVVAITDNQELVLVEQYRPPLSKRCIELPAGLAGDGDVPLETLLAAAQRELEEEAGFTAAHWRPLWEVASSAGMTPETVHLFVATGLTQVSNGGGTQDEDITVHKININIIDSWLAEQQARNLGIDAKVYAALYAARAVR